MTSAAQIASKVARGYGIGALKLGRTTAIYRPSGAGNPISGGNLIATVLAAFNTNAEFNFANQKKFGLVTYSAMIDPTPLRVGDYLVSGGVTYFITELSDFGPTTLQRCERLLTIKRPTAVSGSYSGDIRTNETTLLTAWPAAYAYSTKGGANVAGLPGDVREPWWALILPASVPLQIRSSDVIEDDLARQMRYIISSAEITQGGLRMTAAQAVT